MTLDIFNQSRCLKLPLKRETDGRTGINSTIKESHSAKIQDIHPASFVIFTIVAFLVIRSVYIWIVRYKLQYLLRISIFVFICSFSIYKSPLFYVLTWEPICTIFSQKYFWSLVSQYSGTTCFILLFIRYHWGLPLNIIKDSRSVGFSHLEGRAKRRRCTVQQLAGKMLRHRDPGELNPVYVNGWIPLIETSEVAIGQVVSAVAIGYRFCIYRGEGGQAFVLDAYCPHMGADLAAGGQVNGNDIECPFHGWQFSGKTGTCTNIPYADKIPAIAEAKVWKSCEKNGYIFVWHHAEGEPPSWEIPSIPELENRKWVYRGRSELTVHCHIQEIPENGADIAHLAQVHSRFVFYGPSLEGSGQCLKHHWRPQWEKDETKPHIAKAKIVQRLLVYGYEIPWTRIDVNIEQIGPAVVHLYMQTKFGNSVLIQHITSEGPMSQRVVHLFYTEPKFKYAPAIFLLWGEAVMIQRDIAVWNNKKFLKNPLLVKEDKLVSKFRRWFSQFYSKHSPTLQDLRNRTLEW